MNVSALALDLGSGSSQVTLPATGSYAFTLDGGSGSSDISVPEGAQLSAEADLGSGAARFVIGQNSYVTLTLNSGSGPVTFTMPEGANVKLEVHNGGSNLVLPSWLERVDSGSGDEGVWQTTGFNPDGAQIVLKSRRCRFGAADDSVRRQLARSLGFYLPSCRSAKCEIFLGTHTPPCGILHA